MKALFALCAGFVSLAGCVGAVFEGANITKDKVVVQNNLDEARKGDAEAQYKVGNAYCCSVHEGKGFYDTRLAMRWLCASAGQGYGPAMYKIGKIYSGDTVRGVRLMRRVATRIAGSSENRPVAYVWLKQATDRGVKGAAKRGEKLRDDMSSTERNTATRLLQDGVQAKCRWEDVIRK